jgi:hypothetical protein
MGMGVGVGQGWGGTPAASARGGWALDAVLHGVWNGRTIGGRRVDLRQTSALEPGVADHNAVPARHLRRRARAVRPPPPPHRLRRLRRPRSGDVGGGQVWSVRITPCWPIGWVRTPGARQAVAGRQLEMPTKRRPCSPPCGSLNAHPVRSDGRAASHPRPTGGPVLEGADRDRGPRLPVSGPGGGGRVVGAPRSALLPAHSPSCTRIGMTGGRWPWRPARRGE